MSDKILYKNNEYHMMITEKENELILSWGDAYGHNNLTRISKDVLEQIVLGERTPSDLLFYAENDVWPAPKEVQDMVKKERAESRPITLISNTKNQKLFSQDELKKLIPLAEKAWIDWKGKLPNNYVSPIKNEK
ncbi:hypothetical protein OfM1_20510 [Lactovum odontotermitis]